MGWGSIGRFPGLMRHGTITRGSSRDAEGSIVLTLVEGTGKLLDEDKCLMCKFQQLFLFACGSVSHGIVNNKKAKKE